MAETLKKQERERNVKMRTAGMEKILVTISECRPTKKRVGNGGHSKSMLKLGPDLSAVQQSRAYS